MQKATSDSGRSFKSLLSSYYLSRSKRSLFSNWFSFRQGRQADDVASDDASDDSSNDAVVDSSDDSSNDASDSSDDASSDASADDGQCPSSSGRSGRLIIIDPVLTRSFTPLSLANFVVFSAGAGKYMGFLPYF